MQRSLSILKSFLQLPLATDLYIAMVTYDWRTLSSYRYMNYCNNDRSKMQQFCCTIYNLNLLLKSDRFLAMYVITFP